MNGGAVTGKNVSVSGIIRRTSFIVADADAAASFYQAIFGWTRFYDNETAVDRRFPPSAPGVTPAQIILLKADDPYIGMLGFMEYLDHTPAPSVDKDRTKLGMGDALLVIETNDMEGTYKRAGEAGARLVSEPIDWTVTDYSGEGVIKLATFSFFDPNGLYVEVNTRRD